VLLSRYYSHSAFLSKDILIFLQYFSSIDKAVPKSILSSLIVVGETVLHQTQNAQGFQELLLIMSTLAQSGG